MSSGSSRAAARRLTRRTASAGRPDRPRWPVQGASGAVGLAVLLGEAALAVAAGGEEEIDVRVGGLVVQRAVADLQVDRPVLAVVHHVVAVALDRKSTRLNSSQ